MARLTLTAVWLLVALGCEGGREYKWYSREEMCWHYGDVPPDFIEDDACCRSNRWQHAEIYLHIETQRCWYLPACRSCMMGNPDFTYLDQLHWKWGNGYPPFEFCPQFGRRWRLEEYEEMKPCER